MAELLKNLGDYVASLENTVAEQRQEIQRLRGSAETKDESLKLYEIYTDGSSLGNPGHGGSAFVVKDGLSHSRYVGDNVTNNHCEYDAVLEAVKYCRQNSIQNVRVHTDSNLVVQQLRGHWKVNCSKLQSFKDSIMTIAKQFKAFEVLHVAAHKGNPWNELADKLAKQAANFHE